MNQFTSYLRILVAGRKRNEEFYKRILVQIVLSLPVIGIYRIVTIRRHDVFRSYTGCMKLSFFILYEKDT